MTGKHKARGDAAKSALGSGGRFKTLSSKLKAKRAAVTETALREREAIQKRRADALERKLRELVAGPVPPPGWYEHPSVWFAAGVVLTGAAGVAALHYLDD